MSKKVFITDSKRTAITNFGGTLRDLSPVEIGVQCLEKILIDTPELKSKTDMVVIGNVLSAGHGQNIARQVAIKAGINQEIPAFTINHVCGSSMQAIITGMNYIQAGNHNFKLLIPFLIGSIPLAFIGGTLKIEKDLFEIILFIVLSLAGLLLLIKNKSYEDNNITIKKLNFFFSILIGSFLGLISGIVGIGGGIFLSPILFLLKADSPKNIVTTASLFILINSISGILGQLTKDAVLNKILLYWPLFLSVLLGGLCGNYLNLKIFSSRVLAIITSLLVIFVASRMGFRIFF